MSLPTFSTIVTPEDAGTRETEFSWDIAKSITPWLGVEIGTGLVNIEPAGERSHTGMSNLEFEAKCRFLKNAEHMNERTGNNVGVIAQLHFYLDDLLPNIFRPIFGRNH